MRSGREVREGVGALGEVRNGEANESGREKEVHRKPLTGNKSAKNPFCEFVDLFLDRSAKLPISNFYVC